MKTSRILFWISLVFFLCSTSLLISGSRVLVMSIGGQATVPLGNFTTALGIIALAVLVWSLICWKGKPNTKWHRMLTFCSATSIGLSTLWWPIGRILSGNWSNTFVNRPSASWWFWNYSYAIVGLSLALLLLFFVGSVLKRIR